jgi:hypothetical protein
METNRYLVIKSLAQHMKEFQRHRKALKSFKLEEWGNSSSGTGLPSIHKAPDLIPSTVPKKKKKEVLNWKRFNYICTLEN